MKRSQVVTKPMNRCDEAGCGAKLEKTWIISEFNIPFIAWVCPKSECYQQYKKEFEKKYHNGK